MIVDSGKINDIFPERNDVTLGKYLTVALSNFRLSKHPDDKIHFANMAKKWINYAFDNGAISEGKELMGKMEDCRKSIKVKELERISTDFETLKIERDQLIEKNKKLELENSRLKMESEER